jgi:hypothetical protein
MSELTVGSLSGLSSNSFVIGVQPGSQLAVDGLTTLDGTPAYRYVTTLYYTSSGTFTKATYPWLRAIRVKCVGGGGGSGGNTATGSGQVSPANSGGGGGYAEKFITNIAGLSASETITSGLGGAAGAAGLNNGSAGGSSVAFGVTATGGGKGDGAIAFPLADSFPLTAAGGSGSGADLVVTGSPNFGAVALNSLRVIPSVSGGSFLAGGLSDNVADSGAAERFARVGNFPGGGALGPTKAQNSATNRAGAAGGNGIVIVELYA